MSNWWEEDYSEEMESALLEEDARHRKFDFSWDEVDLIESLGYDLNDFEDYDDFVYYKDDELREALILQLDDNDARAERFKQLLDEALCPKEFDIPVSEWINAGVINSDSIGSFTPQLLDYIKLYANISSDKFFDILQIAPEKRDYYLQQKVNPYAIRKILDESEPIFYCMNRLKNIDSIKKETPDSASAKDVLNYKFWRSFLPDMNLKKKSFGNLVLALHSAHRNLSRSKFANLLGIDKDNYNKLLREGDSSFTESKRIYLFHLSLFFKMTLRETVNFFYQCKNGGGLLQQQNEILANTLVLFLNNGCYLNDKYIEICLYTYYFVKDIDRVIRESNSHIREDGAVYTKEKIDEYEALLEELSDDSAKSLLDEFDRIIKKAPVWGESRDSYAIDNGRAKKNKEFKLRREELEKRIQKDARPNIPK